MANVIVPSKVQGYFIYFYYKVEKKGGKYARKVLVFVIELLAQQALSVLQCTRSLVCTGVVVSSGCRLRVECKVDIRRGCERAFGLLSVS